MVEKVREDVAEGRACRSKRETVSRSRREREGGKEQIETAVKGDRNWRADESPSKRPSKVATLMGESWASSRRETTGLLGEADVAVGCCTKRPGVVPLENCRGRQVSDQPPTRQKSKELRQSTCCAD